MTKPIIFLGSNIVMNVYLETCHENNIPIHGIVDNDYYGNTESICDIPVVNSVDGLVKNIDYYRENFVFFCAVNWQPVNDAVQIRNREKRNGLMLLIDDNNLDCINLIDVRAKVSPSSKLGKSIYIGEFTCIDPLVEIGDYVHVYGQCHVGHHTTVGRNSVVQRRCSIAGEITIKDDVFISSNVCILKNYSTISNGTFIHECIYIRRSTIKNEIVSLNGENPKRVYPYLPTNLL